MDSAQSPSNGHSHDQDASGNGHSDTGSLSLKGVSIENKFSYQPLVDTNTIRILELEPGDDYDDLKGQLIHTTLFERPVYRAISYTWRSGEKYVNMTCNSSVFKTTKSTWLALRRIRSRETKQKIWIDAVCINQDDTTERAQQVRLMGEIFSNAQEVLIWLDEDEEQQDAAEYAECAELAEPAENMGATNLSVFPEFEEYLEYSEAARTAFRLAEDIQAAFQPVGEIPRYPQTPRGFFRGTKSDLLSRLWGQEGKALSKVLAHRWFTRTWVLQEAGLATHALLICGASEVEWNKMVFVNAFLVAQSQDLKHALNLYSWVIPSMTRRFWQRRHSDFLHLLHSTRPFNATDPRDKIFALLSHPCTTHLRVDVNYEKPVEHVYREVAAALIHQPAPLRVLSHVIDPYLGPESIPEPTTQATSSSTGTVTDIGASQDAEVGQPRSETAKPPSWVPSWDRKGSINMLFQNERFIAGGTTRAKLTTAANENVLKVHGIAFDTAVYRSVPLWRRFFFPTPDKATANPVVGIWEDVRASESHTSMYPTGEPDWKAFCTSLTADNYYWFVKRMPDVVPSTELSSHLETVWSKCETSGIRSLLPESSASSPKSRDSAEATKEQEAMLFFRENAYVACTRRRFFLTRRGYYGLGPECMEAGDEVCVLFGANVPFVLRRCGERWKLLGECYLHGIMSGEAIDMWKEGKLDATLFEID